jgi:hypothetical protein
MERSLIGHYEPPQRKERWVELPEEVEVFLWS